LIFVNRSYKTNDMKLFLLRSSPRDTQPSSPQSPAYTIHDLFRSTSPSRRRLRARSLSSIPEGESDAHTIIKKDDEKQVCDICLIS